VFIELTSIFGQKEFVNINHIKCFWPTDKEGAASGITWIYAPEWHGNPTDFINYYKETCQEIYNEIYYTRHEEGK
jgi:hypothetical protein